VFAKNALHTNPASTTALITLRISLADEAAPLPLTQEEFDTYWPCVSIVWKYQKKRERKRDRANVHHIECVWKHNIKEKDYKYATAETGIFTEKNRERAVRDHNLCKCTAKVVKHQVSLALLPVLPATVLRACPLPTVSGNGITLRGNLWVTPGILRRGEAAGNTSCL